MGGGLGLRGRLLLIAIGVLVFSVVAWLVLAEIQLRRIVDEHEDLLYAQRLDQVVGSLERLDAELQKTGLIEAYRREFEGLAVDRLRHTYAGTPMAEHPIVIDATGRVVLAHHAVNQAVREAAVAWARHGDAAPMAVTAGGHDYWLAMRGFAPWRWTVVYAVPVADRYGRLRQFRLSIAGISAIAVVVAAALTFWLVSRAVAPVTRLTRVSQAMAAGQLDAPIGPRPGGEVGVLADAFETMRVAVRSQIAALENEVGERRRLERNLAITLDSIGDAVIATDVAGVIVRINPAAVQLTGYAESAAVGRNVGAILQMRDAAGRHRFPQQLDAVLRRGDRIHQADHSVLTRADGAERMIADSAAPIRDTQGEIVGAVIVFRDVGERLAMEAQLRHSQKMDSIGRLAGGIAHDFNNMLAGIIGHAELALQDAENNPRLARYLNAIFDAGTRASDLTQQLLAFSRRGAVAQTPFDLHEEIENALTIIRHSIDRRIAIETWCDATSATVVGDPTLVQNAIINVALNARDAMPDGGTLRLSTTVVELDADYCAASSFTICPGAFIRLQIADTGCGIPEHLQQRIFEPFFTTKAKGRGTGLGLAAVYGTVSEHRGALTVSSVPDHGTEFNLYFPLGDGTVCTRSTPLPDIVFNGYGTVLVVDDEEVIRGVVRGILEDLGFTVVAAVDGEDALHQLDALDVPPRLVILDLIMPRLGGRECFFAVNGRYPHLPVVVTSGFTDDVRIRELEEAGLAGFLRKPFRREDVVEILRRVLGTDGAASDESRQLM